MCCNVLRYLDSITHQVIARIRCSASKNFRSIMRAAAFDSGIEEPAVSCRTFPTWSGAQPRNGSMEAGNRNQFALVESGQPSIHRIFRRHDD